MSNLIKTYNASDITLSGKTDGTFAANLSAIFTPRAGRAECQELRVYDTHVEYATTAGAVYKMHTLSPLLFALGDRLQSSESGLIKYLENRQAGQQGQGAFIEGFSFSSETVQSSKIAIAYSKDSKSVLKQSIRAAFVSAIAELNAQLSELLDNDEQLEMIASQIKAGDVYDVPTPLVSVDGADYMAALESEKWKELIQLTQAQVTSVGCLLKVDYCDFAKGSLVVGNYHSSNEQRLHDALTRAGYSAITITAVFDNAQISCKLPKQFK